MASCVYFKEAAIKKKYGGILPRKTPLISKSKVSKFALYNVNVCFCSYKLSILLSSHLNELQFICIFVTILISFQDHERAYFDSADWALGKVILLFLVLCMCVCETQSGRTLPQTLRKHKLRAPGYPKS
jgi:hypothetical protein